jgi:hypothetical protein
MVGGGIAGTLAALPMPLGSLTEPLRPRAFAGPGGIPLSPASWAGDLPGAARRQNIAKITNAARPDIRAREESKTNRTRLMDRCFPAQLWLLSNQRIWKPQPKFQWCACQSALGSRSGHPGGPILSIMPPWFGQTWMKCGAGRKRKSAGCRSAGDIGLSMERQCNPRWTRSQPTIRTISL